MNKSRDILLRNIARYVFILLGSIVTAVALEIFLKSHQLIGGGMIGIAVIKSYFVNIPLSATAFIVNLPFLLFIYRRMGKSFLLPSIFAMVSLSFWIFILDPIVLENQEILHAAAFGGILLGIGSGLILHYGGFVDGIIFQRTLFKKRFPATFILINLLILLTSGMVLGWDKAIYSLMACFISIKAGEMTFDFFNKSRKVIIVSEKGDTLSKIIMARMGKSVTFLSDDGAPGKSPNKILYPNASTQEIAILEAIAHDIDANAFVHVSTSSEEL